MAPENYNFDDEEDEKPIEISVAFDVWSLGCIIAETFSGIIPWENYKKKNHPNEIIVMRLLERRVDFPIPESLPDKLSTLLKECFKTEPEERITTEDLLKRLTELSE